MAGAGAEGAPLKEQKCVPCHQKNLEPLSREEAEALQQKVGSSPSGRVPVLEELPQF